MKIKIGIFFGGPSREREISFAGGRTVYDNLNKAIFEPIPIFVDSFKNYILLDWQFIYKGTIRDFYPPIDALPTSENGFQIYAESLGDLSRSDQDQLIAKVGQRIAPEDLPNHISIAFLALHGVFGEDGEIQSQLDVLEIPYTGSGIQASKIGMDKSIQKELMGAKGFPTPNIITIKKEEWLPTNYDHFCDRAIREIGYPVVVRPANQGSSIGVSIIESHQGKNGVLNAIHQAFFRETIPVQDWIARSPFDRKEYVRILSDIRDGLGFPLDVSIGDQKSTFYHPDLLLAYLDEASTAVENQGLAFVLESHLDESKVILESFIRGKEFSCIVIRREDDVAIALPPTEIIKGTSFFDYRSKYMPGFSRKVTPIDLPEPSIEAIRKECERLFEALGFQTYARIDGFITEDETIFLNDPNTTSGMLPSSFFFHQAAEIGLNPSQFLTYIIRTSLQERLKEKAKPTYKALLQYLDEQLAKLKAEKAEKRKIAVFLGGYSFERHISVESGRNIFEKLASSEKYEPLPIFLTGNSNGYDLYQLPINLLLKDNADDIRDKIQRFSISPVIEMIKQQCRSVTDKYASDDVVFEPKLVTFDDLKELVDGVFIALHGRPGEDGQVQQELDKRGIPYNGSGPKSSSITINKFQTLQILKRNGFEVAQQFLAKKTDYEINANDFFTQIESNFNYPLVAKPVDDGCSSAVRIIKNRDELEAYTALIYRENEEEGRELRKFLKLKPTEEFPIKQEILFESLITANGALGFMEITGGLMTSRTSDGTIRYEVFEPSEVLATDAILSLEEKFLAGEGQNITPARFSSQKATYDIISGQVKQTLEKAARILDVQGYARIDAFVRIKENNQAETIIIEVNSLPGMTPATVIFHQAALRGYKPYDFIDQILGFAFNDKTAAPVPVTTARPDPISTSVPLDQSKLPSEKSIQKPIQPTAEKISPKTEPKVKMESNPIKHFFQSLGAFFISGTFIKNCLGILLLFLLSLWLVSFGLNRYTLHGKFKKVPEFEGMIVKDADKLARQNDLRIVVSDSVFLLGREPNIIIEQTPIAKSKVKRNRQIYVTITSSTAPMVTLPSLVGNYDYFQYTRKLERLGIKYKIQEKQFDRTQEENSILYFYYNGEKITDAKLRRNLRVPKGSILEFVITERNSGRVDIPDLRCKRFKLASFLINSNNLELGEVVGPQSNDAYVDQQSPAYQPGIMISAGTPINLTLTYERPPGCPEQVEPSDLTDTTQNQSNIENN